MIVSPLIAYQNLAGLYRITGVVDRLGVVGAYRVRLFLRTEGVLIRDIVSAQNGNYAYNYLTYRARGYSIIVYDHDNEATPQNASIADLVTPEPMP